MQIFSFVSDKGGCGKTTVCTNFAAIENTKNLLIDCDPLRSSGEWFANRPEGKNLSYIDTHVSDLPKYISWASNQGYEKIFIDSAGRDAPSNKMITDMSDVVIMPCKPSLLDQKPAAKVMNSAGKKIGSFKLVINQGFPTGNRNAIAIENLSGIEGAQVSPTPLITRAIYQDATFEGLSVVEMAPSSKAGIEMKKLWEWVNNG